MFYTGNTYRSLVETPLMKADFNNIILYETGGVCSLGLSGESNYLRFLFSGQKIFSPSGKFISTFNSGEPFSLSLLVDRDSYQYQLDGRTFDNQKSKPQFNIQRVFVNSTGLPISFEGAFYSENISYSLEFPEAFSALNYLTGRLTNHSNYNFKILNTSLVFYNGPEQVLTGNPTGSISASTTQNLLLADSNTSLLDSEIQFGVELETSIGTIQKIVQVNRVSGLEITTGYLETATENEEISVIFDGSGNVGNIFTYVNTPGSLLINYYCPSINLRGEQKSKNITISITGITPQNGIGYTSQYVTGISFTTGGEYLVPPFARFSGYYSISGLDTALNSILLSSGCSGAIPVTFSGNNSRSSNASGVLYSQRVVLSGIYGEGRNTYYLPQSFSLLSGGTGYVNQPSGFLQTGLYANCYDVGSRYNSNYLIFSPFRGMGMLKSQADYLTGEVLTTTGLVSGGAVTGYIITGIEITNPGSGYNSGTFIPRVSFVRQSSDTLTRDATGIISLKNTGLYNFSENWSLNTGLSSTDLTLMPSSSASTTLDSGSNYLTIQVNYSGKDWTQPVVCQLSVTMGHSTITHLISGVRSYDTTTGYLKKKNNVELLTFNANQDLSFDLTEDEISEYYSSSDFLNNGSIEIGDLDFGD